MKFPKEIYVLEDGDGDLMLHDNGAKPRREDDCDDSLDFSEIDGERLKAGVYKLVREVEFDEQGTEAEVKRATTPEPATRMLKTH